MKRKIVVFLFGPPGSGKGTQAQRVAERFGLAHVNTGALIERTVHDSALQTDPVVQRERNLFDTGFLCTPEWVAELIQRESERLAREGMGIVFSASPRTLLETERLIPVLEHLYGRENLFPFRIQVRPETSIFRNSNRRICEACETPLLHTPENARRAICPLCGGRLITRTLDNPEIIPVRLAEYRNRTKPIFEFLTDRGYSIIEVDGESNPDTVAACIERALTDRLRP